MKVDYNDQAKQIFENNKAKGWHENTRSFEELVLLIQSEAFEGLEALRKGKFASIDDTLTLFNSLYTYKTFAPGIFKEKIKDTFEDEIADVYIRTLDMCHAKTIYISKPTHFDLNKSLMIFSLLNNKVVNSKMYELVSATSATWLVSWCESVAFAYGFNLQHHVALKLAYNATRPAKHGKKF
jgi:NTP pyrophosphatase (non-canonical NTP hydrolase)